MLQNLINLKKNLIRYLTIICKNVYAIWVSRFVKCNTSMFSIQRLIVIRLVTDDS